MGTKKAHKVFDSLLVLQCQSGNKKAVTLLVKRWHVKLCKHAYWYTNDKEVAKDIVQDSWNKIIRKINDLKDPNSFGNWAFTIVTRNAIDWQRRHKKELGDLNSYYNKNKVSIVDQENGNKEQVLRLLDRSIKELSANHQIVLNLFYLEEYSIKEISEIINVSPGTVKSRLFTARENLKSILKSKNYEK